MLKTQFHYTGITAIPLPGKRAVRQFISSLFEREGKILQRLDYIFCSDEFLLKINQTHLNHDFYTDIITFDLSEGEGVIGEIYISLDRVKENAKLFGNTTKQELLRVIIHGALHLCGYLDKTKTQIAIMRKMENSYLLLYDNL